MTKKVVRVSATGERVEFPSVTAALAATSGIPKSNLFRVLKNGKKTRMGAYEGASPPLARQHPQPEHTTVLTREDEPEAVLERNDEPTTVLKTDGGHFITEVRLSDGFVNATRMCQGAKKEWKNYWANSATKNFTHTLSTALQIPLAQLIKQVMAGPNRHRGTWIHPLIATHLAYWCSADFAVKVSRWVEEYKAINPEACKEWRRSIYDLKVDKHRFQERGVRDRLQACLGGDTEVPCRYGRVDLVTSDTIVEVKRVDKYLHALGQVLGYGRCMPEKLKRVHLFGDMGSNSEIVKEATALVESFGVQCTFETVEDSVQDML